MDLQSPYANLSSFLAAEFADADLAGLTDEDVAQHCVKPESIDWHQQVIIEGRALLNAPNFPWPHIGEYANRYFEDEIEAREWLKNILEILEQAIRKTPKRDPCA